MKRFTPALLATLATAALIGAVSAQTPVTTIQYWNINTEAFGAPAVRDLIAKFESKNPGIKIEPRAQTGYTGLLQNALAAGRGANRLPVHQLRF